jgi:predicted membrane channel-forming protein YqfA (hemolysin III family)
MKRLSKYERIFFLMLAVCSLTIGALAFSLEHSVLVAQRLVPDSVHSVSLSLKGKIFYVTRTEKGEYYFYQHLFFGLFILGGVSAAIKFATDRRKHKTIEHSDDVAEDA